MRADGRLGNAEADTTADLGKLHQIEQVMDVSGLGQGEQG